MNIEQYAIDVMIQKLEECEQLLSDECYDFLASYEDIEDILVYKYALIDYLELLEDRFWCNEEDDTDEDVIKKMLMLIHALINAMSEEDDVIIIEP